MSAALPRVPRGHGPRGPCGRQSPCVPSGCDTRGRDARSRRVAVPSRPMKPGVSAVGGSSRGWVQGLARAPDGALWAVLYRATVLRSTDGGDTWTEVPSPARCWLTDIAVTPDGAVLVGDEKGALHETRDGGQNWAHTPLRGSHTLWSVLVTSDAAMVGVGGNVFRRRHGESGWTPAKKGPRGFVVRRLSRTDDGVIFAACADMNRDRAAWRSRDGGDTWQRVLDDVSEELLGLHASGDRVYALLRSSAVMVSADGGDSWARHALPFDARRARIWSAGRLVHALDVATQTPAEEGVGEVWRSADAGETWSPVGPSPSPGAPSPRAPTGTSSWAAASTTAAPSPLARPRGGGVLHRAVPPRRRVSSVAVLRSRPDAARTWALMLDRVLVAWRATRHPTLAVLVDALGARCAPPSPPTAQAPWIPSRSRVAPRTSARSRRPGSTPRWTRRACASTRSCASTTTRAWRARSRPSCGTSPSARPRQSPCTAVGAKLIALRDPHTAVVVGAASQRAIPVRRGATMKAWLARYLPGRSQTSSMPRARRRPRLDAADRALCAAAERLLRCAFPTPAHAAARSTDAHGRYAAAGAREGRRKVQRDRSPHAEPQLVVPRRLSGAVARVRVHPARPERWVCRWVERHRRPRWRRLAHEGEPVDALPRRPPRGCCRPASRRTRRAIARGTTAPLPRRRERCPACARSNASSSARAPRRAHPGGGDTGAPRAVAGGDGAERESAAVEGARRIIARRGVVFGERVQPHARRRAAPREPRWGTGLTRGALR